MTWMNWRYMYPHDLGNLHMRHNDNSSSQPQQWKRSIFYIGRWQHILNVFISPYGSKYLLRKWDWGMIWGVGRTFLDSGHGSIRMYHKPYSAILINQCSQLIMEHHRVSPMRLGKSTNPMMGFSHFGGPLGFLV